MANSTLSWVNGQLSDQVSVYDRAFAFGDGLFETFLVSKGRVPLLDLHLARLEQGLQVLHIPLLIDQVKADIAQVLAVIATDKCYRVKYIVSRGESGGGYQYSGSEPNRVLQCSVFDRDVNALQQGIRAQFCRWPLSSQPELAGVKHLNRLDQVMAAREIQPDCFEGLMRDSSGFIVEGTMSNIFMRHENTVWQTPKLETSGVKGVMRANIMAEMPKVGLVVEPVNIASLARISEMFICNALIGLVPVLELDGQCFTISEQTRALQSRINTQLGF